MSANIKRNMALLKILIKAGPEQRRAILCGASDSLIAAIAEIALNTLRGNVPLKPEQFKALKKKKTFIRQLSNKKLSLKKKKRLIEQSGGFIGPLLGFAIPLLTSLLTK